jgi:hypothetical protein
MARLRGLAPQAKMVAAMQEAGKWRAAFKEVANLVGYTTTAAREPDVQAVLETVQRLKTQGQSMQARVANTGEMSSELATCNA